MTYTLYIDISAHASDETHITIVENSKDRKRKVRFSTIGKGLQLDSVIHRIVEVANKFKVTEDQVFVPHNPSAEEQIRRRLPRVRAFSEYIQDEEML